MRLGALFGVLVCLSSAAFAGPFGLNKGQPISSLKVISQPGPGIYVVTVPLPNPEFQTYVVAANPQDGVCKVSGIGRSHANDRYGSETQSAYGSLKSALSGKYQSGLAQEFVKEGALFPEAADWVMAVKQNERVHQTLWGAAFGKPLSDGLGSIALMVKAVDMDTSYLQLSYEFDNFDSCMAKMKSKDNEGL